MKKQDKNLTFIKNTLDEKLVDIVCGPMNLEELSSDLRRVIQSKYPEYVVILIQNRPTVSKYHSTIYVSKSDFEKPYQTKIKSMGG